MTAPAPQRQPGRLTGPALGMLLALAVLLVPVGYLAVKVWSTNNQAAEVVATERAAVAFGRPMVRLMALLVDARSTAVEKITIEDFDIQAAIREINLIDRDVTDRLGTAQRWSELTNEINSAVSSNTSGSDALRTYAATIALAQDMLASVVDSSQAVQDPAGTFHLLDVALHHLPDAIAAAGEVSAVAASGDNKLATQIELGTGKREVERLAEEVSLTLRGSTGRHATSHFAADLRILKPLDAFSASAHELIQAAAELAATNATGVARTQIKERIDTAGNILRTSAVELAHGLLDTFDSQLSGAQSGYVKQRWFLAGLYAAIALAVGTLVWLRFPWPQRRRPQEAETDKQGRHGLPEGAEPARSGAGLVDARELTRESTDLGRAVGARKR